MAEGVSAPPQGDGAKGVTASPAGCELSNPEYRAFLKREMAEKLGMALTPELEAELEADLDLMLEMDRKEAKAKARRAR